MVGLIAVVRRTGVLVCSPWSVSGVRAHVATVTHGATLAVTRTTWADLCGWHPFMGQRTVVLTTQAAQVMHDTTVHQGSLRNTSFVESVPEAIHASLGSLWFLGGPRLLEEVEHYCGHVRLVTTDDSVPALDVSDTLFQPRSLLQRGYLRREEQTGKASGLMFSLYTRNLPERFL